MQLNTLFDIVKKKVIQTSFIYLPLRSKIWNIILSYYIIYVILEALYWIQQLQFKRCKMNSKYQVSRKPPRLWWMLSFPPRAVSTVISHLPTAFFHNPKTAVLAKETNGYEESPYKDNLFQDKL